MKVRRMLFAVVVSGALLLCSATPILALNSGENGFESLPQAEEFEQIEPLSQKVVEMVNSALITQYGEEAPEIDEQDLHWEEAYKIYVESDVFASGSNSTSALLSALESGESFWRLPIYKDNVMVTVDFAYYGPLSENAEELLSPSEYQREVARQNSWSDHSIGISEVIETHPELFIKALEQNQLSADNRKVIIGGFSKLRSAIGVTMNDQTVESVVILQEPALSGEPGLSARRSTQIATLQKMEGYDFDTLGAYMRNVPEPIGTGTGGGGGGVNADLLVPGTLLGVLVLFIGGMILLARFGKKTPKDW